jgi:hypothetical protein
MHSARFQIWFGDSPAALGGRPADESGQPSLLLLALVAVLVAGLLVLFVFGQALGAKWPPAGRRPGCDLGGAMRDTTRACSSRPCSRTACRTRATSRMRRTCSWPAGRLVGAPLATGWLARVAVSFPSVGVRARARDGRTSEDMRVRVTGRGFAPPCGRRPCDRRARAGDRGLPYAHQWRRLLRAARIPLGKPKPHWFCVVVPWWCG